MLVLRTGRTSAKSEVAGDRSTRFRAPNRRLVCHSVKVPPLPEICPPSNYQRVRSPNPTVHPSALWLWSGKWTLMWLLLGPKRDSVGLCNLRLASAELVARHDFVKISKNRVDRGVWLPAYLSKLPSCVEPSLAPVPNRHRQLQHGRN